MAMGTRSQCPANCSRAVHEGVETGTAVGAGGVTQRLAGL